MRAGIVVVMASSLFAVNEQKQFLRCVKVDLLQEVEDGKRQVVASKPGVTWTTVATIVRENFEVES